MAISIGWLNGIVITNNNLTIRFDPRTKNNLNGFNFFSHSHGDHIYGLNLNANNYLTSETQDILFFRQNLHSTIFKKINYDTKICIDDFKIIAHNAGHILGSAQFEVQSPDLTVVYSGDINCRNMLTTKAADIIPCDILILESTYGHPNYVFPSLGETCSTMVNWSLECLKERRVPFFQVYSTGKAQEVIKIFNKFTKLPLVVHPLIAKVNKAYQKNRINLTYTNYDSKEGTELLNSRQCVVVAPNNGVNLPQQMHSRAIATGWALKFRSNKYDNAFPLSGHADFNQLINYVKQVKPKQVFTIHGFRNEFADYLSKKHGIKAIPLIPLKQRRIHNY